MIYLSLATLTTLGYGDIVPVTPIARMVAALEAVAGVLYIAITVARLVAGYRGAKPGSRIVPRYLTENRKEERKITCPILNRRPANIRHAAASFHLTKTTAATSAGTREKTMWRSRALAAIPSVRWTRSRDNSPDRT